jgi:hypothetical protein
MKSFLFLSLLCGGVVSAHSQSTAFTYQGRLAANGTPYSGFAEMQFTLFNAPTGGVAVAASAPAIAGVNVSGGLFAVSLDFGAGAFTGADRFLEIQVRTNLGPFSTLTPRQALTPTPSALFALTAGTAGPWSSNGSNAFYNAGNVGIGIATPQRKLHVLGDVLAIGNVEVSGDVNMGVGRQYHAASGEEFNLRIVRGTIAATGAIRAGSGFTAAWSLTSPGDRALCTITFNTPFASTPTVTATKELQTIPAMIFTDGVTAGSAGIRALFLQPNGDQVFGQADFSFIAVGQR